MLAFCPLSSRATFVGTNINNVLMLREKNAVVNQGSKEFQGDGIKRRERGSQPAVAPASS
jgi:hypothetical protein